MTRRPVGRSRPRYRGAFALWLSLAALPAAAQVGPLTYQSVFFDQASNAHSGDYLAADAGLFYTGNAQFASNGSGDSLLSIGLSGNTAQEGSRLNYRLNSDIALVKYLRGTFPTEPTGYLDGEAALKIVPGFFSWIARETYTQVQINPFAPVNPDNLENLNYITTGPRFTLRPTLRTTVTLDALYSYLSSNSSSPQFVNIDNQRYGGDLKIDRAFSSISSLYLTGSYSKVDFKDQVENNNFNFAQVIGGYRLANGRTFLDVSGGYTQVKVFDVPVSVDSIIGIVERRETQTFSDPNWAINLSRLISPSQRVALIASQQLMDAATALRLGFDQAVPTIAPPQVAAGDPFQNRQFGADWRFEAARTSLDVSLLYVRQRYLVDTSNDRTLKIASALFARQLNPVLNWDIGVSYQHQDASTGTQPSSNGTTVITNLRWRLGEHVGLRFLYAHYTDYGITDNQVGLLVSYVLAGAAQPSASQPSSREQSTLGLQPTSPMSTQSPYR